MEEAQRPRCWRCQRDLNVSIAPRLDSVVLECQRCHAKNVVQQGKPVKPLDALKLAIT